MQLLTAELILQSNFTLSKEESRNQFVQIEERIAWMRSNILAIIGGGAYYKTPIAFQFRGKPVIWFERDEKNFFLLNIDLQPVTNRHRLQMKNNFWHIVNKPEDFVCRPSGKEIRVAYKDSDTLWIKFSEKKSVDEFQKLEKQYPFVVAHMLSEVSFPLTTVEITMTAKEKNLMFNPKETRYNGVIMRGYSLVDCQVGLSLW